MCMDSHHLKRALLNNKGLGLKAVWYGAEQLGNIIGLTKGRDQGSSTNTTDTVHWVMDTRTSAYTELVCSIHRVSTCPLYTPHVPSIPHSQRYCHVHKHCKQYVMTMIKITLCQARYVCHCMCYCV